MHPLSRNGKKAWNHAARPACRRRTTMPSASRGASDCNQHMTCIHGFHGFLCFMLSSDSSPVIMPHFAALRKSLPRPRACARTRRFSDFWGMSGHPDWCSGRDSNPQGSLHMHLKHACLPISPPEQVLKTGDSILFSDAQCKGGCEKNFNSPLQPPARRRRGGPARSRRRRVRALRSRRSWRTTPRFRDSRRGSCLSPSRP